MKRNIFIGTIKKCKNLYQYKKYGEEHYACDFILGHTEFGSINRYVDVVTENAILMKLNSKKYIWFGLSKEEEDKINIDLSLPIKILNIVPSKDNDLFVDEKNLKSSLENENIGIKKIKSLKK